MYTVHMHMFPSYFFHSCNENEDKKFVYNSYYNA